MPTTTKSRSASAKPTSKKVHPTLAALIALAALRKGEHFAGIVRENSAWHLVVLLPGELESATWSEAVAWATKKGGLLPSRNEQALLFANLKDQFQPRWYWSGQQYEPYPDYAWVQGFYYGYQDGFRKLNTFRARAVRRLPL